MRRGSEEGCIELGRGVMSIAFGREVVEVNIRHKGRGRNRGREGGGDLGMGIKEGGRERALWMRNSRWRVLGQFQLWNPAAWMGLMGR